MRFRPLSRDYWPSRMRQPFARLAFAAAVTPVAAALAIMLSVWLVSEFAPHPPAWPFQTPFAFFFELALELYFFGIVSVAPIFILLWSLRLRTQTAFIFGGMLGGAVGALASSLRFGSLSVAEFLIAIALGIVLALVFRGLAGVRHVMRD